MKAINSIQDWLNANATLVKSEFGDGNKWVTKTRGDYITLEGMEEKLSFLVKLGITEQIASIWEAGKPISIGFSPERQQWFGWSHRAVCGFGVGSTCKRGDCHYRPTDKDDFLQDAVRFWTDDTHLNVRGEHRKDHVLVQWDYPDNVPNEALRGKTGGAEVYYPNEWGKGEWTAKTLSDARQMAIDFAESVS